LPAGEPVLVRRPLRMVQPLDFARLAELRWRELAEVG
jgi:hypothetical protein